MHVLSHQALVSLILIGTVVPSMASSAAIGLAVANGSFQVDNVKIWGNATLFDGITIETGRAPSQLKLNSGSQMDLGSESRARVYQDHLILEKGVGLLKPARTFPVDARHLRIASAAPDTVARVELKDPTGVLVVVLNGSISVANETGVTVAKLGAGNALNLDPQGSEGSALSKISGCLFGIDGKAVVVDETTNVTMELRGMGLENEFGNVVEITGTTDKSPATIHGASQALKVMIIKRVATGGCPSTLKRLPQSHPTGATSAMSTSAKGAIIAGVAASAVVGGLAAAGALPGQNEPRPPSSR